MGGILENWQQAGNCTIVFGPSFSVRTLLESIALLLCRASRTMAGTVAWANVWRVARHAEPVRMRRPDKENRDEVDQASLGLFGQWYLPIGRRLPAHRRPRWRFGRVRKPGITRGGTCATEGAGAAPINAGRRGQRPPPNVGGAPDRRPEVPGMWPGGPHSSLAKEKHNVWLYFRDDP
jgi:hypothetical protein